MCSVRISDNSSGTDLSFFVLQRVNHSNGVAQVKSEDKLASNTIIVIVMFGMFLDDQSSKYLKRKEDQ